jgi:hypothetical protein
MQKTFTFLFTAFMLVCASCKKADVATPAPLVTPAPPAPPAVIYDSIFIANTIAGGNKEYAYYQVKPNSAATSSSGTSGGFPKGCISLDNKYRYQLANLVAVNIDGTNEQIVLPGTLGNFNKFISPCFSKDNAKIYYANSNNEIRSVNANGTGDALVFTIVGLPIKKLSLNKAGTHFFIAQSSTTAYTVKQIDINGNNEILIRNSGVAFVDFLVKN